MVSEGSVWAGPFAFRLKQGCKMKTVLKFVWLLSLTVSLISMSQANGSTGPAEAAVKADGTCSAQFTEDFYNANDAVSNYGLAESSQNLSAAKKYCGTFKTKYEVSVSCQPLNFASKKMAPVKSSDILAVCEILSDAKTPPPVPNPSPKPTPKPSPSSAPTPAPTPAPTAVPEEPTSCEIFGADYNAVIKAENEYMNNATITDISDLKEKCDTFRSRNSLIMNCNVTVVQNKKRQQVLVHGADVYTDCSHVDAAAASSGH